MKWLLLILMSFLLIGCDSDEVIGEEVAFKELTTEIDVVERSITEPAQRPEDLLAPDITREANSLTFVNSQGITYVVPNDERFFREPVDRIHFEIFPDSYVLLGGGNETRALHYSSLDTTRKELKFVEMTEHNVVHIAYYSLIDVNAKDILGESHTGDPLLSREGFYQPDDFAGILEINPDVTFEQFADTKTLGKGVLKIKDFGDFLFYVALAPRNPIVMDLNGDGAIDQGNVMIVTMNGNVLDLSP